MSPKKMTLEQIAAQAGVTKGTVSKILNRKASFSREVTERVTTLLEAHGHVSRLKRKPVYVVSRYAENAVPEGSMRMLLGALHGAQEHDLTLDFKFTHVPFHQEAKPSLFAYIRHQKPTAILLDTSYPWPDPVMAFFQACGVPVVQFGFENHSEHMPAVVVDSMGGAYQSVRRLIQDGHRRIATIRWQFSRANPTVLPKSSALKHAGLVAAMAEADLAIPPELTDCIYHAEENFRADRARDILDRFLALPDPPTAVVVENSFCSVPTLFPRAGDGGRLPPAFRNLTLLHFEDYPLRLLVSTLTHDLGYEPPPSILVTPSFEQIGRTAVDALVALFDQPLASRAEPACHKIMPEMQPLIIPAEATSARSARTTGSRQR